MTQRHSIRLILAQWPAKTTAFQLSTTAFLFWESDYLSHRRALALGKIFELQRTFLNLIRPPSQSVRAQVDSKSSLLYYRFSHLPRSRSFGGAWLQPRRTKNCSGRSAQQRRLL